jgi:glycosyltransferase involved in cell wall biosynthesis
MTVLPPPRFSIVLATRDRPALFAEALGSVLAQSHDDREIIVVNDGSQANNDDAYRAILSPAQQSLGERLRLVALRHRPRGHGQSYALNVGVEEARGRYVCFLDDDDLWTDPGHLARAAMTLEKAEAAGNPIDLYLANQRAWVAGVPLEAHHWLSALDGKLRAAGRTPDDEGAWHIGIDDLMRVDGFCHLNCLTVRRDLFLAVGGMDETIRWECDHDLFLRLVDTAARIVHHPAETARHNVPDAAAKASMTTSLSEVERRLWQLRALDKAALFLRSAELRRHGRRYKGHVLKRIASALATQGDTAAAAWVARQALGALPTTKWAAYASWLSWRGRGG